MNSAALACQATVPWRCHCLRHGQAPGFVRASLALLPAKWLFVEIPHVQYGKHRRARCPALDELVPSRYALKVGDVEVLVISDGVLPLPTQMLGHNVPAADRAEWFEEMYLPQDAFDWALNVMVVHSGDRTILIDAGLGMGPDLQLPRAGQLIRRLGAAGINLGEITDVVITHMHMDHVGGLLVEGVKEQLRPDLKIHVAAAEVEFWKSPDFSRTNMPQGFPDALRATAKHFWAEYSSYVHTFQDEQQIAPGVTARRTGGHTRATAWCAWRLRAGPDLCR